MYHVSIVFFPVLCRHPAINWYTLKKLEKNTFGKWWGYGSVPIRSCVYLTRGCKRIPMPCPHNTGLRLGLCCMALLLLLLHHLLLHLLLLLIMDPLLLISPLSYRQGREPKTCSSKYSKRRTKLRTPITSCHVDISTNVARNVIAWPLHSQPIFQSVRFSVHSSSCSIIIHLSFVPRVRKNGAGAHVPTYTQVGPPPQPLHGRGVAANPRC